MQKLIKMLTNHKKWIILLIVLIAAGSWGYSAYSQKNKPVFTGKIIAVERGDILAITSATGTINPVNSVDVSSKITGRIEQVFVEENQQVKEGQILIKLDDTKLQATVAQAKAKRDNYLANYQRMQRLSNIGAIAPQQLDSAKMDYSVAQAAYDDAVSQLSDTVITAPVSGIVIGKPIPAGQTVSPGISTPMVLLTIADMSKMQIETKVDETDIGKIKLGQKASFNVDSYPDKTFTGVVSSISKKAVIEQNVVYYTVYIDIDSSEGLLMPTMTARVSVNVGESKDTIVVPLSALKESKGQKYVQVMISGKVTDVPVQIGLMSEDRVEVITGLKDSDQIVLRAKSSNGSASAANANDAQKSRNASRTMRSVMGR